MASDACKSINAVWQMWDLYAPQIFIAVITFHLLISLYTRQKASAKRDRKVPKLFGLVILLAIQSIKKLLK